MCRERKGKGEEKGREGEMQLKVSSDGRVDFVGKLRARSERVVEEDFLVESGGSLEGRM